LDFIKNPYPTWDRLMDNFPVAWHTDLKSWVVTRYEYCFEAERSKKFSLSHHDYKDAAAPKPKSEWNDFDRAMEFSLTAVKPAEHIRLRKLTQPAFSRQVMDKIEHTIRDLVVKCFDDIGNPKEFNIATEIANKIPVPALARMAGVPKDAQELFEDGLGYNFARVINPIYTPEERKGFAEGSLPGLKYIADMVAAIRKDPSKGNGFMKSLVETVSQDGDRLTDWDIIALIGALVSGADTAVDLHICAIDGLLRHPAQHKLLRENPNLVENALLESMRWGAPNRFGTTPRYPFEDTEFGGQMLGKGEPIMVATSSAFHDWRKWPEPRKFDITRNQDGNLVFGAGAHFCIGLNLAKAQGKIMLEEFDKRFPNAELVGEPEYDASHFNARRMTKLMVRTNVN
jgi:cytochrome P450